MRVLKRESPIVLAREVVWRARREWSRKRMPALLARIDDIRFRHVPYYVPALQSVSDRARTLILCFADEICAGRYPFLSYETPQLGVPPKWNLDFVSGAEWPCVPYEFRECLRQDGSDIKVPYELSRLQFLPILGKAHVLTGEDSYRQTAKDLVAHWIHSNPVLHGVNWTLAMEAALRAMSICFLLNLLSPFRTEEQPWLESVTRSLAQHLHFIEGSIEFSHLVSSNHYLSNVVGLYCLSLFLDGEGMEARRREYRKRIEAEMAKQVYDDGGDYEASTGYQVLVTQFFATALLLMRTEDVPADPTFVDRLRMMFRFLQTMAGPSMELPHVGDGDDGRTELLLDDLQQMVLLPVSERNSLRVSHLLGLGQCLFGEGHGKRDDAAWYGFSDTTSAPYSSTQITHSSPSPIEVLPKSGIGVLRHGSAELFFLAIPNGISGKGSHTHNDKLSFILRIGGKEIICDSGTGCYTRDIATRNRFRGTAAHNTVMIDGVEQNRIPPGLRGLFILGNEAAVGPIHAGRERGGLFLRASHHGYGEFHVTHTRTIRLLEGEQLFVIEDELDGDGIHDFELNFQLGRSVNADVDSAEDRVACRIKDSHWQVGDPQVQLVLAGPRHMKALLRSAAVGTAFGVTVPAAKICIRGRAALPARITTRMSWTEAASASDGARNAKHANVRAAVAQGVSQA